MVESLVNQPSICTFEPIVFEALSIYTMKVCSSTSHTLRSLLVLSLSAYVVASPMSLDALHQKALVRSLPGSVAAAPAETVGYQPSPLPAQDEPSTTTASESSDQSTNTNASRTENTDYNDESYDFKQQMGTSENSGDFDASHIHIPSVSEMDAMMMKTETASASKSSAQLLLSFVAFVLLLHC
ncbi:uncharacterized protein BDV14DRAFT_171363 [Aspergillus stella-maris]|uniref:uncharacterized protein n=1 Tax=Aspergillus stella-maris TaxID=1810926 RepID=UPI003CCE0B3E